MNARATIEGYMAAAREAEDNVEDLDYQIEAARRELRALESKRVGAHEAKRKAHDALRKALASQVRDEVSFREVEIAAMKGIHITAGDPLTPELKERIRSTPALARFQP